MIQLSDFVANSVVLYTMLAILDVVCSVGVCVILSNTVFSLEPKIKFFPVSVSFVLCATYGVLRALTETGKIADNLLYALLGFIVPFICMTLFFFSKKVWKSYIVVLALNISSAVKYLILMGLPNYDFENPNYSYEFLVEAAIDIFTFVVLLAVYLLYVKKYKRTAGDFSRHLPMLIVLVVLTTILFVSSMVISGTNLSPERRYAYFFTLLCFPAFAATVIFATRTIIKSSIAEDSYRQMLDMQLKHFKLIDKKNDELRMFRHDFPKQMAPLLMHIKNGDIQEAEQIVNSFNVSVQNSKSRFNTGNYQLDTVLECEQQIASKHNITIDVISGSTFPTEGVRSEDIYTVFPNALDNAIEACTLLGEEAVISFESHIKGNMVFVRITNPYDGSLKIGKDGLKTRKKDKDRHGFGVRSMQKSMSAYGVDNLSYETKNGRITLNLFFELN